MLEQDQEHSLYRCGIHEDMAGIQRQIHQAELADMSDMDIKLANIGSNVFIAVKASLLDAMEV